MLFSGVISGAPSVGIKVTFALKPVSRTRMIPFIRLGKPVNNWNVQPGTIIRWRDREITVEGE
jgi:hypothetical protein